MISIANEILIFVFWQRREKLRVEENLKRQSVPVPTLEQREETFRRWLERKREQVPI